MSVLHLAADTAADTSNGFTLTVGWIGLLLSIPCWFIFIKGFAHMVRTIMAGQKTYGHTGEWGARVWTTIKEVVGHTKMAKKPGVAVAHWFVIVGFLWKTGVEVVILPITYQVIAWVKKREGYYDQPAAQ